MIIITMSIWRSSWADHFQHKVLRAHYTNNQNPKLASQTTMWRRICSSQLKAQALALAQSSCRSAPVNPSIASRSLISRPLFASRHFSADSGTSVKKRVEDVNPVATGHEREELEAELEGKNILEIDYPTGPFGTKDAPAVVKSYYDKRIVGCPGGEGEDEHDVVWFWLEKGKPHECPVCSQYFVLEVVGPGGPPDGHGDDDHH